MEAPTRRKTKAGGGDLPNGTTYGGVPSAPVPPPAAPHNVPPVGLPWGNIIDDVYRLDVQDTYARLNAQLSLGEGVVDYSTVIRSLDKAEANMVEAARLARKAQLEDEEYKAKVDERLGLLREAARAQLHQEKEEGKRSKAATIQEVDDRLNDVWSDEVRALRERQAQLHGVVRVCEELNRAWASRCASLRTILERLR